jgi:beta-barrel assembly-enhancing protease
MGEGVARFQVARYRSPVNRLLAFFLLPILTASVVPRDPGISALHDMDLRVATIGHQLALANARQCPNKGPQSGILLHSLGQYGSAFRTIMQQQWGLTDAPTLLAVVPGSAAQKVGLFAGDQIRAVNGVATTTGQSKKSTFAVVERTQQMLEQALRAGYADILTARAGNAVIRLVAPIACPALFQVLPSQKMKATADGRYVQLSTRIIESARDDDELSFIIAHELAHNALGHRAWLDKAGRKAANVRETEIAADVLGVKMMRQAGYDPAAAARYWAREGDRMDAGLFRSGTHLSPGKRVDLLRNTAIELVY